MLYTVDHALTYRLRSPRQDGHLATLPHSPLWTSVHNFRFSVEVINLKRTHNKGSYLFLMKKPIFIDRYKYCDVLLITFDVTLKTCKCNYKCVITFGNYKICKS